MEKPHMVKILMVDPMVEIMIQVVTCHLSTMEPIRTHPMTDATLNRITVNALREFEAPRVRAWVGK